VNALCRLCFILCVRFGHSVPRFGVAFACFLVHWSLRLLRSLLRTHFRVFFYWGFFMGLCNALSFGFQCRTLRCVHLLDSMNVCDCLLLPFLLLGFRTQVLGFCVGFFLVALDIGLVLVMLFFYFVVQIVVD